MPAKNKAFRDNITDKHLAKSDIVKKNRPQARNNTVTTPKPKPKSKHVEKRKLAEKRQLMRESALPQLRKDEKRELYGAELQQTPPKPITPPKPDLSASDLKRRAECEQAIAAAEIFNKKELLSEVVTEFEKSLLKDVVDVSDSYGIRRELDPRILDQLFYHEKEPERRILPSRTFFLNVAEKMLCSMNKDLHLRRMFYPAARKKGKKRASLVLAEQLLSSDDVRKMKRKMARDVPFERWLSYVAENKRYGFAEPYSEAVQAVSKYDARNYTAPDSSRRFILDIGPTNSGKTYSGMQRLQQADSGVYLGPLRLLAMEVAETMNTAGTPCSLVTGEEQHIIEGAFHVASTVEMLDRGCRYDVAVIDECQMITDPERGYAWASAIVSVNAETVHLCLAPEAERLIRRMLDGLGEEYEVSYHDRLVPLKSTKSIRYPKDIRQGDAIVVFSRKSVQEYASFLESKGMKASMIYGALPYDVRREEVRKFMDGETQVVVATDAIGMGLNLPVKRVVFAEIEKFDGHEKRQLTASEIKQIAGRAGRYGKYEIGYATATTPQAADIVARALETEVEQVSEIRMDMPYRIVSFKQPLSMLMRAWQRGELPAPYVKRDLTPMIELARRVEDLPNELVAEAIEIPFRSGDKFVPLDDIWERDIRRAYEGETIEITLYEVTIHDRLQYMEDAAKVADLAYGIAKRYGTHADMTRIEENRRLISELMIAKMKEEPPKICQWCCRPLPTGSKYDMHSTCYREYRREKSLGVLATFEEEENRPFKLAGKRSA